MTTFNATRFEFDAEVVRIEGEIEDLQTDLEGLPDNSPKAPRLAQRIQDLQAQRKGVIWARGRAFESDDFPAWDEDVDDVTLGAITAGVYGRVQNDLGRDPDAGEGTANTLIVAEATVDAPYAGDDVSDEATIAAVAQLHPYFIQWAKDRVDDLLDPESGNGTSSGTSPGERDSGATSTDE